MTKKPGEKKLKFPRTFAPRDTDMYKVKDVEKKADKDIQTLRAKKGSYVSVVKYVCLAILQYDPRKQK